MNEKFKDINQEIPNFFTDVYDINENLNDATSESIKRIREVQKKALDISDIDIRKYYESLSKIGGP